MDAAWHEWYLLALAVLFGGMLAVSAQCECCHHWLPYFFIMPYLVWYLVFCFFVFLLQMILNGVSCRDYGLCFGGGSYSAVYVPPPLCVFPVVLVICIPSFFFFLVLYAHFLFTFAPKFSFLPLCVFSMLG